MLTRRSFLSSVAGAAAAALAGCSPSDGTRGSASAHPDCPALEASGDSREPLWQTALRRGIIYGSSTATWQLSDAGYRRLFARESAILFTEDDLLWYRLRPTPKSGLDFNYSDRIVSFANRQRMLIVGAHLVWDEGFGDGWTDDDLWGMDEQTARDVLYGTIDAVVERYRGEVAAWIVANEVLDALGLRTDVPWHATIGPSYVTESFHRAHEADSDATLVLNEFGYETDDGFASAVAKRAATLRLLDQLLDDDVPVHALGVQAHLHATNFAQAFEPDGYRRFLSEIADRGLKILITEMDVLDNGLPPEIGVRDQAVADVVGRYLEVALEEPAVASVVSFGLSDRYTWLEEDYQRLDGAPRRPLPFNRQLRPKLAHEALRSALEKAPRRNLIWEPPGC